MMKFAKAAFFTLIYILLFMTFRQQIDDLLWLFNQKWLNGCDSLLGGIVILSLGLVALWKLATKYKDCIFGHHLIAGGLFVLFLYIYHRWYDPTFFFWSFEIPFFDEPVAFVGIVLYIVLIAAVFQQYFAVRKATRFAKMERERSAIQKDNPIKNVADDLLGYSDIVESLLSDLEGVNLEDVSFSVGITGEWGMGKSSLFNIFKKKLDEKKDAIVYCFNPRGSATIQDIQQDFFDGFASKLSVYHSGMNGVIKHYQKALQIVDDSWWSKLLSAFSSWTVTSGMDRINDIIRETGRRVYIFIDDLDRLTAPEILEVMKLIGRNGNFVNTIFITAYDKAYVNTVLRHYLKMGKMSDFTDKYFSHEISLPVQSTEDLKKFAMKQIEKSVVFEKGDVISNEELLREWGDVSGSIIPSLHTLRHVKRYINILLSRYSRVKNDVVFKDFAYLTLLRYKDIKVYHAIVEGKLLQQGNNLTGGSLQQYYLKEDYEEELKKIAQWDGSRGILCELFKEVDGVDPQMVSCYHRLRHVNSFANYYYDYQKGGIYYRDLIKLYQVATDEEAFTLMKELLRYDEENKPCSMERYQSVEDFLLLRPLEMLGSLRDMRRLVMLLLCLIKYSWRSVEVETFLTTLMFNQTAKALADRDIAGTEDEYQIELETAIDEAVKKFPLQIGYVLMLINMGLNESMGKVADIMISQKTIIGWLEWCQKLYIQEVKDAEDKDTFARVTELSKIFSSKNDKQVTKAAQAEFIAYITAHAKAYADFICLIYRQQPMEQILVICYNHQYFMPNYFFPYNGMTFSNWVQENVANDGLKSILLYLDSIETHIMNIDLKTEEIGVSETNYGTVWRLIQRQKEESEESKVLKAIEKHIALSISLLSADSGLSKDIVRQTILRLIDKKKLSAEYANLAEEIPPFKEGDFICVRKKLFEGDADDEEIMKDFKHVFSIYKISTIKDGMAKLTGLTGEAKVELLEAVPIDGEHDRNIYYDPAIAESDGSVPHSPDIYYMRAFEYTCDAEGKSYKDIVKERNYHFVHEIQHWLHGENDYGLKINRR